MLHNVADYFRAEYRDRIASKLLVRFCSQHQTFCRDLRDRIKVLLPDFSNSICHHIEHSSLAV